MIDEWHGKGIRSSILTCTLVDRYSLVALRVAMYGGIGLTY
jgi:hypothetical protein